MNILHTVIILFVIASILGWLLEISYRSFFNRQLMNPGFLNGPFLPIYGFGAILIFVGHTLLGDSSLLIRVAIYFVGLALLELTTGILMNRFFNVRLWHYFDQPLHINGYICPGYTIAFTALATGFDLSLFTIEHYMTIIYTPTLSAPLIIFYLLMIVIALDFVTACGMHLYQLHNRLSTDETLRTEFDAIAQPLLNHPEIARLAHYNHHSGKTRLDHVEEVAWSAFKVAAYFSLDLKAIVRGALLHDLFYYDWLREGPRFHGFKHPKIALNNAMKLFDLSLKEQDMIKKHMWPLTLVPPRYAESWVICLMDTKCAIKDYCSPIIHRVAKQPKKIISRFK